MKKQYLLWGMLVTGCLVGIFSQGIAYFFKNAGETGWPNDEESVNGENGLKLYERY